MPIPFIIIAIALLAVGAASTVVVKWDDIQIYWTGKRLAVLGERAVGKTHLIHFLTTGTLPDVYRQGVAEEKTGSRRFQLKTLDLKIKESWDVPGSKDYYQQWKELVVNADVVLYLVRADHMILGDVNEMNRVREDLGHIGDWLDVIEKNNNKRPQLFIVGTHCDLDNEFLNLTPANIGSYEDKFRQLSIIEELILRGGGFTHTKVVLGSMKTIQSTEALVFQIFSQESK